MKLTKERESPSALIEISIILLILFALATRPASGAVEDVVGHYEGAWTNLTFGSVGAAVIDIEVMGTSASLTFDMDGGVFGGTNPASITMPGNVVGDVIQIDNQGVGIYGDIKGTVDTSVGALATTLTNIPGGFIQQVLVAGTITNGVINLGYTVVFPRPPDMFNPAYGVMTTARTTVSAIEVNKISVEGTNLVLGWTGGVPPFTVQMRNELDGGMWTDLDNSISSNSFVAPYSPLSNAYFRVGGQ